MRATSAWRLAGTSSFTASRTDTGSSAPHIAPRDWTDGCIAVNDQEIEEIWRLVDNGTAVEIRP
jgi:L,D-peptidoglycan transpeptidase YkuD (ErfK/YbiS/YcfS/YnhG family)